MKFSGLVLIAATVLPSVAAAQGGAFTVSDVKLTSGVENKEAVDQKSTFATRERVYLWMKTTPTGDTQLRLRWSLNGAPVLLPTDHTQVRRSLNSWFDSKRIHPVVAGEFDDSALMFWLGQTGAGAFPAPTVLEAKVQRNYGVKLIGRATDVVERFYAISLEAQPKHPGVVAVCSAARKASVS